MVSNHSPCNCLGNKEAAAKIRVEDKIPVVPRDFERRLAHVASRIVDEDVNLPKGRLRFRCHALDAGRIANVKLERDSLTSQRSYLRFKPGQSFALAARKDDVGPGLSQGAREVLAKPTARSRNEGNLARKVELGIAHDAASTHGARTIFIRFGS